MYSTDPFLGTQYYLYFKTSKKGPSASKFYHKVTLFRPFYPSKIISNEIISTQKEIINLILPISQDRLAQLINFLENIRRLSKFENGRLKLFLIYFGNITAIKPYINEDYYSILSTSSSSSSPSTSMPQNNKSASIPLKIIHISNHSNEFSRAKALQFGTNICCKNNSLLFFCDVDLIFTNKFLERCRLNASFKKKVYYPILFSLYNPKYSQVHVPNFTETTNSGFSLSGLISSQTGFWRDFGFGMTCQYKSDFLEVGGFNDYINSMDESDEDVDDNDDEDFKIDRSNRYFHNSQHQNSKFNQQKYSSGWGGQYMILFTL